MSRTTVLNIAYAVLASIAIVVIQQWWIQRQEVETLAYSEFEALVQAGKVKDVYVTERQIRGTLKDDELDAMGRARGVGPFGGGHDEKEQTLNQLLVELDGFDPREGIVLLAATNRPEILDPALLRAGRFDRHIVVDRPDRTGRAGILRLHAAKVRLAADVDLDVVASMTPGFTGRIWRTS